MFTEEERKERVTQQRDYGSIGEQAIKKYLPDCSINIDISNIKNLGILFLPRSGSNWLSYQLKNYKNISRKINHILDKLG